MSSNLRSSTQKITLTATISTLVLYTLVTASNLAAFFIHTIEDTLFQDYKSNSLISIIVDNIYGVCYILSMISMLVVFVLRIQLVFKGTCYQLSSKSIKLHYLSITLIAFLGISGAIFDILRKQLLLYIIAGLYITLLFVFSIYLLHLFINKLTKVIEAQLNPDNIKNINNYDYLLSAIVRLNVIVRFAIISTFILTILGSTVDMFALIVVGNDNSNKSLSFRNNAEYITRTYFVIDAIIGCICLSLTLSHNEKYYQIICPGFHSRIIKSKVKIRDRVRASSDVSVKQNEFQTGTDIENGIN